MGKTLFTLAGPGIIVWGLLIFLPRWRVTRWLAKSGLFPAYLAVLYLVGIVPLLTAGAGSIMQDFATAEGVVRLLGRPEGALIAWIHILVFDQVVSHLIYLDNMRHRYVPLPLQSLILFATLMFGPVGFLVYYAVRVLRKPRAATPPAPDAGGFLPSRRPFAPSPTPAE